jgi:6-phosphogluconolactonase
MEMWLQQHDLELDFWNGALEDLVLCIRETLENQPDCRIGLAGGSTPEKLYQKLSQENLPWDRLIFILLDERRVPSDHPESNLRMIRRSLFNHLPQQPKAILYFDTSLTPVSSAREMERRLKELERESRPLFDVLVLGAGSDGHLASLFEGDRAIESKHLSSPAFAKGYATPERSTLTLQALSNAKRAILLLKGPEKNAIVERILKKEHKETALDRLLKKLPFKIHHFA